MCYICVFVCELFQLKMVCVYIYIGLLYLPRGAED